MADRGWKIFNRDVRLSKGSRLVVNDIVVVDGDGNIDAPVTTTNLSVSGTLSATGATSLGSTLAVTGASTFTGAITANGGITLGAGDSLVGSATSNITFNTDKFTVAGATGNTVVAGTLGVTGKITADDVDLASGAVVAWLWTGANGIVLKNLKNSAASALSGTQLDVEIDIGGTPYYFTVYPTKA